MSTSRRRCRRSPTARWPPTCRAADLHGIFRESDPIRTYPNGSVGASVVGFVGADGKGLAGLERTLNAQLAGVEGKETYESAPNGSKIPLGRSSITPARNGLSYQLTLDSEVQWVAERRLAEQVAKNRADSGFAIVLDVKTGQVIALANAPTYDSSRPQAARSADRGNRAISAPYEPGSVEKVLTSAALIDSGTANPSTRVVIPSRIASGGHSIKDFFSHGVLHYTMRGVIADSSNIGTALLTRQLDKQTLHDYLVSFGLGSHHQHRTARRVRRHHAQGRHVRWPARSRRVRAGDCCDGHPGGRPPSQAS